MYERMLERAHEPNSEEIRGYLGEESYGRLVGLKEMLEQKYHLVTALRFPFGKNYGWGYKFSDRSTHLCYALFERDAFSVLFNIGDKQAPNVERVLDTLQPKGQELWMNRYPCGERGGWFQYRVLTDRDLDDVLRVIYAKREPADSNKEVRYT